MPGSCSSGFRSLPSAAAGTRRRNGLDVNSRNIRKPIETSPITASTRASSTSGRLRERSVTAVAQRGEHQHPQQQRAFVRTPRRRDPILQRQLRVRVLGDVDDGKIAGGEAPRQASERQRHEEELRARRRLGESHQDRVAPMRADQWDDALDDGDEEGKDQGEMAEFGDHLALLNVETDMPLSFWAFSMAPAASGGM